MVYDDQTRRMAKVYGVTPEALPDALAQSERERQARDAQFQRAKGIQDAHAAGKSCGADCDVCRGRSL